MTIEELSSQTGFRVSFIRKCLKDMKDIISPHTKRGDYNSILFDSNAVVIFDRIKQQKDNGLSFSEIKRQLESDLKGNTNTKNDKTNTYQTWLKQAEDSEQFLDVIVDLQRQLTDEKEKTYREREERLKEKNQYDLRVAELEQKSQALHETLKLLPEGKDPATIKREWEDAQKRKLEAIKIMDRLEELEGRWFKGSERKELIKRLRELGGVA